MAYDPDDIPLRDSHQVFALYGGGVVQAARSPFRCGRIDQELRRFPATRAVFPVIMATIVLWSFAFKRSL
jgi:hypothetical protein